MTEATTQTLATVQQFDAPLSPDKIHAQVQAIQRVMAEEMKEGIHFGTIPGTGDKPGLFKAGAEKLCMTFHLAPKIDTEDIGEGGEVRIRTKVRLYTIAHGLFVGEGVGEASTLEDKYAWEMPKSDAHWEATPPDRRRIKYTRDHEVKQVRANVADRANTVLKMSKKRALVDAVLTATAASDMFGQDLDEDDVAGMVREQRREEKPKAKAKAKPELVIPYGPGKGKTMGEATVAELQKFIENKERAFAEGKVAERYITTDQALLAAAKAELATRAGAGQEAATMTDQAWMDLKIYAEEECRNSLDATLQEFGVTSMEQVPPGQRQAFYDALNARVVAAKKKS